MIPQLVQRYASAKSITVEDASTAILFADPIDLVLVADEIWSDYARLSTKSSPVAGAREKLAALGAFTSATAVTEGIARTPAQALAWDHLGYAYVLENTRVVQIMRRVVREYRHGESLGLPSALTLRWLDATEALVFGAQSPALGWLGLSQIRPDPEASRWNAYWRLLGVKPAFGREDGSPITFVKSAVANTTFVPLFEELAFELWQAISNIQNSAGVNQSDDDRIYRIAEQLGFNMRSRRVNDQLMREELHAATVLGWFELTLGFDNQVMRDLKATGTSAAERLREIGDRVGLAPHSRSASFFAMAADLSRLLRAIENPVVTGPAFARVLYSTQAQGTVPGLGQASRRVITEWSAATGKDLKTRARPVEVDGRRLVGAGR